jgi:hypothetical protein
LGSFFSNKSRYHRGGENEERGSRRDRESPESEKRLPKTEKLPTHRRADPEDCIQ